MRLRARVNPLVLVLVLLPLLGWGAGFEATLLRRRSDLAAARSVYAMALALTRSQLGALAAKVTSDATLAQNLDWKLAYSVAGTLSGKLQKGVFDQVSLIDKGCNVLGRASFDRFVTIPCPLAAGAKTTPAGADGAFWVDADGKPGLAVLRPLPAPGGTYALGLVQLDDTWLSLHPELKSRMDALGLTLGGGAPNGADGDIAPAALVSDRWLDRLLESRLGQELAAGNPFLWPCLALAFAAACLSLWRERNRADRARNALAGFTAWCRALSPSGDFVLPGKITPDLDDDLDATLAAAKKLVSHALQLKSDALHGVTQKRQALEGQLKMREEELQRRAQRLAELAELDSLAVQLQRTTASFLEKMNEFHGRAEDLSDVVGGTLASQGQVLVSLVGDWQHGVAERGARKFLRGLSETATAEAEVSELDRQLAVLAELASGIGDLTVNASAMAHKLVETAAFAARLASLWHGLALKTQDEQTCTSLAGPVAEAQGLVRLEQRFAGVAFSNLLGEDGDVPLPELPKPIWTSALYHLYLAMAELTFGVKASVATRLRRDGDKVLLIIQAAAHAAPLPKRGEKQAYHMEITRSMLAPFHMTLSVLPALDGPFPVALAWSASEPYRKGAPQPALPSRPHAPEVEPSI